MNQPQQEYSNRIFNTVQNIHRESRNRAENDKFAQTVYLRRPWEDDYGKRNDGTSTETTFKWHNIANSIYTIVKTYLEEKDDESEENGTWLMNIARKYVEYWGNIEAPRYHQKSLSHCKVCDWKSYHAGNMTEEGKRLLDEERNIYEQDTNLQRSSETVSFEKSKLRAKVLEEREKYKNMWSYRINQNDGKDSRDRAQLERIFTPDVLSLYIASSPFSLIFMFAMHYRVVKDYIPLETVIKTLDPMSLYFHYESYSCDLNKTGAASSNVGINSNCGVPQRGVSLINCEL